MDPREFPCVFVFCHKKKDKGYNLDKDERITNSFGFAVSKEHGSSVVLTKQNFNDEWQQVNTYTFFCKHKSICIHTHTHTHINTHNNL